MFVFHTVNILMGLNRVEVLFLASLKISRLIIHHVGGFNFAAECFERNRNSGTKIIHRAKIVFFEVRATLRLVKSRFQ
jgi:hypothetical protein